MITSQITAEDAADINATEYIEAKPGTWHKTCDLGDKARFAFTYAAKYGGPAAIGLLTHDSVPFFATACLMGVSYLTASYKRIDMRCEHMNAANEAVAVALGGDPGDAKKIYNQDIGASEVNPIPSRDFFRQTRADIVDATMTVYRKSRNSIRKDFF